MPYQISWLDKDGEEIKKDKKKKNIVDEEEEVEGTKLHNAVSTVKLEVGKEEHGRKVTCLATHETYCPEEPATCPVNTTILLMVKYKPELTITQVRNARFGETK